MREQKNNPFIGELIEFNKSRQEDVIHEIKMNEVANIFDNELPERWSFCKIGEIVEIKYGKGLTEENRKGGEFPVYGSNGIVGYHDQSLTQGPTIIIGRKGSVGEVNYSQIACWPIDTTYFIDNFVLVNPNYIFHLLRYSKLGDLDKSTAIPGVNRDDIYSVQMPLPPLPEQRLIVARVDSLLEHVRKAKESLEKIPRITKSFRQAALKKAFSGELTVAWREQQYLEPAAGLLKRIQEEQESYYQTKAKRQKQSKKPIKSENELIDTTELPELPEGWVWTKVGEISKIIHYGYTASSTDEPTGTKMLRITDIQNNTVNWNTVPFCEIEPTEKEKYLLNDGDLVFARTGATVGKSFLIRGKIPEAVFASYLIRVLLSNHIQKDFVYDFFQSHEYWLQINKGQIGIGQPNVNSQTLSKIALPLPPFPEQQEIVRRIESLFKFADETEKKAEEARRRVELMTQSILARAFRGDLTADFREAVKNWKGLEAETRGRYVFVLPEDKREEVLNGDEFPMEPASELLRRIGEERTKMMRKSSKPKLREQKQKLPA